MGNNTSTNFSGKPSFSPIMTNVVKSKKVKKYAGMSASNIIKRRITIIQNITLITIILVALMNFIVIKIMPSDIRGGLRAMGTAWETDCAVYVIAYATQAFLTKKRRAEKLEMNSIYTIRAVLIYILPLILFPLAWILDANKMI